MYWNDLNSRLKAEYGCKVYKLALSSGCSCPNRDGTLDTRGCIFCDGAGAFAEAGAIPDQLAAAKTFLMVPDYLNYLLCGVAVNEYTNASTTALVDSMVYKLYRDDKAADR